MPAFVRMEIEEALDLGAPLFITSVTTAVGFLALLFAAMPPFKIFGAFTVVGILVCWLLSVTFIPAVLALMQPKVGAYLKKRQSLRVQEEQSGLVKKLVALVSGVIKKQRQLAIGWSVLCVVALLGSTQLFVHAQGYAP